MRVVRSRIDEIALSMDNPDFAPLQPPIPWPPPDIPPYPRHLLSRVPIVGWPFRYFRWLHYWSLHQKNILEPIEQSIVAQLQKRPAVGPWPQALDERLFVELVSQAVAFWKGLATPVAIHPDDPLQLLFWGPFEDLTPLQVCNETRKHLKRVIPKHLMHAAWQDCWPIRRFTEEVIRITPYDT